MRNCLLILTFIMLNSIAKSQGHGGIEQYYYTGAGQSVIVPKVYYESSRNWYSEVRYNYEELQTVSVNAGKMFHKQKSVSYTIIPFAGMVLGRINGGTVGSNLRVEYQSVFFSSESQYTFSIEKRAENFFFNWSEMGYQLTKNLYAGLAFQLTHPYDLYNYWKAGAMLGLSYKSWTFPLYVFNPAANKLDFVLGVNWEWRQGNSGNVN